MSTTVGSPVAAATVGVAAPSAASAPSSSDASSQARLVTETIKKVTTIATLPEITNQIIKTVEDPKSTAAQLHKIVSHDPALVTRIMKVVNSSFYGLPGQIGSIERAIVLLGLNAVKNLAVAASLGQLFRGVKGSEGFSPKDLWTHCIAVGVAARDLARQMALPMTDEAFLAGMIHDMGILVELQVHPEQARQVIKTAQTPGGATKSFCELERETLGVDHQQLGQALAEQWKFPRALQLVAGYHHRPTSLDDRSRLLVTIVCVADTICCQSKQGFSLTAANQTLDSAGATEMGIEPAFMQHTTENLATLVKSAADVLG